MASRSRVDGASRWWAGCSYNPISYEHFTKEFKKKKRISGAKYSIMSEIEEETEADLKKRKCYDHGVRTLGLPLQHGGPKAKDCPPKGTGI